MKPFGASVASVVNTACCNRMPQTEHLPNSRDAFFTVLGPGKFETAASASSVSSEDLFLGQSGAASPCPHVLE